MITVFTDGSSLQNPGPGGYCAIIKIDGKEKIIKGGQSYTTNNRMELKAVIEALKYVKSKFSRILNREARVRITSDSRLLISTMTKSWKRKENLDLWIELEKLIKGLKIEWHWVKGHGKHKENEICDRIAKQEAGKIKKKRPTRAQVSSRQGVFQFFCNHCKKSVSGKLAKLSDTDLIRADCEHCGKFIKFAKHSKETLRRIKEIQPKLNL